MSENRLRAHLLRIYMTTVAVVLLMALAAAILLYTKDASARNREVFSTLFTSITEKLRTDIAISHSALKAIERENRLILCIRDSGKTLLYNGSDGENKQVLFDEAEARARESGCDVEMLPLTSERRTSPISAFSARGRRYLGAVCIIPVKDGYRTATMVQDVSGSGAGTILLFALAYFVSLLLLSFIGIRLIDRALQPAAESRLRQTQFIAAASHELRSPLAVISANAETLKSAASPAGEAARAIESECARMSRLIGDLLLLAAADAKSWSVQKAPLELDTILMNAYEAYSPVFARAGCELTLALPEEALPNVSGDAGRLSQVLEILLDNALSYGMGGKMRRAEMRAGAHERRAEILVLDHGAGMTKEQKAHAFDRFYRGDASRREKQHFGLGLSIAKELIRLQGGSLEIADTPGGGCTFRILL